MVLALFLQIGTHTKVTGNPGAAAMGSGFSLGARFDGSAKCNCEIAAVMIINYSPSDNEIAMMNIGMQSLFGTLA